MQGTVLGGYRLVTELGSGGMGTVYFAEHLVIGRRAAIKVLHPDISRSEEAVARFLIEARAVNDIRHPNVVQITDLGRANTPAGDVSYIVMELLEGETLGERLERAGKCDERTCIRIVRQVAGALGAAHERGIVHRDLKPENIYLTNHPDYPDHVKLLDFGIAKLLGGARPNERGGRGHTQAGTVIGTPAYMSPEQCRADADLDHRSDIYSLGVVLYEMLTGKVPFAGAGFGQMILAHVLQAPKAPKEVDPTISDRLNDVVMRALEKDRDKRFPSMKELRDALEERPVEVTPTPAAGVPVIEAVAMSTPVPAAPPPEPDKRVRAEKREAHFVVDKLTQIILGRLASDRLALPAMPGVAFEAMNAIRQPNQTFGTVAAIAARDPLLAARILKLANSAAFPSRVPATTLEQAIARMGIDGLTAALVEFSMEDVFSSKDDRISSAFRGIWEHSLATALLAKDLAALAGPSAPEPSTTYVAGLLHDVGKPVVASLLLEAERMLEESQPKSMRWLSESVWKRVVADSHRAVGCALAEKWNLPDELAAAIRESRVYDTGKPRACANFVCFANALAKREGLYVGDVDASELHDALGAGRTLLRLEASAVDAATRSLHKRIKTLVDPAPTTKNRVQKTSVAR